MWISFESPLSLLVGLVAIPAAWMAWRSVPVLGRSKAWGGLALRVVVIALMAVALAQPAIVRQSDALTLLVVNDGSASVPAALRTQAGDALKDAMARTAEPNDRAALLSTAANAQIVAMPGRPDALPPLQQAVQADATDLAAGIRMALAVKPADTQARMVLVSDGNQTMGNLMEAADLARAAGVPVDVVPLQYKHERELMVETVQLPARVRSGQSVNLKVLVRSQRAAAATLRVWQDDQELPLNESQPGTGGMAVQLEPGANMFQVPVVTSGMAGVHHFRVRVDPDDPQDDSVAANNAGAAAVLVEGQGSVLLVEGGTGEGDALARVLAAGGMQVERRAADTLVSATLVDLAGFDAVALVNVPRWSLTNEMDRALHAYVHDLGGGLVMLGGPESFGAGGWLGSRTADALPVRMDPPQTRAVLRTALAIVLDASGSMTGAAGASGRSKQTVANEGAVAALKALTRLDEVAVIAFSGVTEVVVPLRRRGDGEDIYRAVRAIGPGGGTVLLPALQDAGAVLSKSNSGVRHMIVLTDGRSDGDPEEMLSAALRLYRAGVTISTVAVGEDADFDFLKQLADAGRGRNYIVKLDKAAVELPQVLVREAMQIARSLVVEGDFQARLTGEIGGPLAGVNALPPVRGYVLCVPREGLAQVAAVAMNAEGPDPLVASWNYGTGRSVAVTTDLAPRWGAAWLAWGGLQGAVEQMFRWSMRPPQPTDVALRTSVEGSVATVEVTSEGRDGGFASQTRASATLVRPDGSAEELPLRQVSAGRFVGTFELRGSGAHLADVAFAQADGAEAVRAGRVQAVVTVPYPAEYRAIQDDTVLLSRVAERTGGRVLRLDQAATWDLFNRAGLGLALSSRAWWDVAALLAAIVLLLDIAWRRIAWDRRDLEMAAAVIRGSAPDAQGQASVAPAGHDAHPGHTASAGHAAHSAAATQAPGQPRPVDVQDRLGSLRAARDRASHRGSPGKPPSER